MSITPKSYENEYERMLDENQVREHPLDLSDPLMCNPDKYEEIIRDSIDMYCSLKDIKDITELSQNRFNAILSYVGKECICKNYNKDKYINLRCIYNTRSYDYYKLNVICNIYIDLCNEYDKEINCNGLSKLCNIEYVTFNDIINDTSSSIQYYDKDGLPIVNIDIYIKAFKYKYNKECILGIDYISISSSFHSDLRKKILLENENSLSDMLISAHTGRQAIGLLGALNRKHGWNMGQPTAAESRTTISLEELQQKYPTLPSSSTAALDQKDSLDSALNADISSTAAPMSIPSIDDID